MDPQAVVKLVQVSRCCIVSTFAVLVYEWIDCFPDEVRLIYGRRWSHVSLAYVLCRYYPLLVWVVVFWAYNWNHAPDTCMSAVKPVHGIQFPFQLFGQAVMVMRAYAFSGRNSVVLALLLTAYGVVVGGATYMFLSDIPVLNFDPSSPMAFFARLGCFPNYGDRSFRTRIGIVFISGMLLDSLNLIIVCFCCLRRQRYGRSALGRYFYKQGLNVFIWMTAANVAAIILYFSRLDNGIGVPFVLVMPNILACRIILQLRSWVWRSDTQIARENSRIVREALAKVPPVDEWAISVDLVPVTRDARRGSREV